MTDQNIFVSYSRADADLVIKLSTDLKEAGVNLWLDQLDIAAGETWDIEIEKALEACECVLFIVSRSSVASNNALNEVYYALEEKKKVLPIKVDDCKMPFRIKRLQYIDLSGNYDEGFKRLLNALNLRRKAPAIIKDAGEVKEPVNVVVNSEENVWRQAKNENTRSGYEKYLTEFPEGKFRPDALKAIDTITTSANKEKIQKEEDLWKEASNANTIASYRYYITSSELALHKDEANKAISISENKIEENDAWEKAKQINTINSYKDYQAKYGSGQYIQIASTSINKLENSREESLWNEAKLQNTLSSIQKYLDTTTLKKHVQEAENVIKAMNKNDTEKEEEVFWLRTKQYNTVPSYHSYLNTFKTGKYTDDALRIIKELETNNNPPFAQTEVVRTETPENNNKEKEEEEDERQLQESLLVDSVVEGGRANVKNSDLLLNVDERNKKSNPAKNLLIVIGFMIIIIVVSVLLTKNNSSEIYPATNTDTTADPTLQTPIIRDTELAKARNKKITLENIEAFSSGNIEMFVKDFSPDIVDIMDYGDSSEVVKGIEPIKKNVLEYLAAFPDNKASNVTIFAASDSVKVYLTWSGTFKHDLGNTKATGKHFSYNGVEIYKFDINGKIVSHRSFAADLKAIKRVMSK